MERLTDRIQHFFETNAFGVCTRLGEILGVATSSIRLLNMRKHLRKRNPVWDY